MNIKRIPSAISSIIVTKLCLPAWTILIALLIVGCHSDVEHVSGLVRTEHGTVRVVTLAKDLDRPWSLAVMPKGDLLITEKAGVLKRYNLDSGKITSIKGLPKVVDRHRGGLFDVVLHPEFDRVPWVYLSYSIELGEGQYALRLGRGLLKDNRISDWEVLFTSSLGGYSIDSSPKHFGGGLAFSSDDGYLYMSLGDRFSRPRVQESTNHIGKIIRLHDDGRIPEDNPWAHSSKVFPEIYSFGLRNPQSMTADNHGRIWLVDHGPLGGDELNLTKSKANYGWPIISGGAEYDGQVIGEGAHKKGMDQPVFTWPESVAPSGITFYEGDLISHWKSNLFISCLLGAQIKRLELKEAKVVHEEILFHDFKIRFRDIISGLDGNIYILAEDGRLFEIGRVEVSGEI